MFVLVNVHATSAPAALVAIQAFRDRGTENYDTLQAIRAEIARGFDNEAERLEYEASEEFLVAELFENVERVRLAVAEARRAGHQFSLASGFLVLPNGKKVFGGSGRQPD